MFDGLVMFVNGVAGYLTPTSLALAFGSTLLGILAGCMPGLSATLVITLLTTLTLKMQPNQAILVLVCAYNGAIYGGSRTAILLNIPGTAANAAACIDGYQLARQGQAGRAMGIATTGSVVGTLFGLVCLALFTPLLGEIALKFGAFEFFWLALLGVVLSGNVVAADPIKGWLAGFLGLFVAGIGQDGMYAYERFAFGNADLAGGFGLIPVLVGAFGFSEVLTVMSERFARPKIMEFGSALPRVMDVLKYWRTIIRSGVIGVWIGILPGVGEDMAAWSSYATAKRLSKNPEEYGKGSIEGLMAAETGDNASVPGGIIPALALAIPGSAPCAVLLAAMIIHGVQAGPDADGREPAIRVRRRRDGAVLDARHPVLRAVLHQAAAQDHADPALVDDAADLRAVRDRVVRTLLAAVRRLHNARLRRADLRHAPLRLSRRAVRARHRARRHSGQELAARTGAERRRHSAVHHAAAQRTACTARGLHLRHQCSVRSCGRDALAEGAFASAARRFGRHLMRISLCNEVIAGLPFAQQCELAAALGYDGLEPAPFHVQRGSDEAYTG